jgi:hypothetical protein
LAGLARIFPSGTWGAQLATSLFPFLDRQEIAQAIHVIQYRLLSRPTYQRYKEAHKKSPEKK